MFRSALATCATVGFAVLALLTQPLSAAQLPDAPSAVKAGLVAAASLSTGVDQDGSPGNPGWKNHGEIPAYNLDAIRNWPGLASDSSPVPWVIAANREPVQQSLDRSRKRAAAPGFSSSIAEQRPIPGNAPALQNPCPHDACSLAQEVMCCGQAPSPFERYLKSPDAVPLTARDNLHSALMNIVDPFNLLTIAADSAIGIASDSHTVYGPGVEGFSKYAGVSLTEDITGEFFGTFLIPSIMHQDPHYHREPFVSPQRRVLHAITAVVWAKSYTGQPMFNYGNIFGGIATAVVSNTFVPGPGRQGFGNTSQRLALAFAISPTGNLIEEFVPDIASRINLRVVIFQRILNTVSLEVSGAQ